MSGRILQPELMDDQALPTDELERALGELSGINRWLGGHRTSRLGIEALLPRIPSGRPVSILDIASGGTDLREALGNNGRRIDVISFDLNPRALQFARRAGHKGDSVVGTAHALPFKERSFDIVHLSLFLHHCTNDEARELLRSSLRIARVGVVVNELHRHGIAAAAIAAVNFIVSRSEVVRHDAVVSVRRAFTRTELRALVAPLNARIERLTWQWAFRWCFVLRCADPSGHE